MYWGTNDKCSVSRSVSRYIVHVVRRFSIIRCSERGQDVTQTTLGRFGFKKCISHRNTAMETKVPDFVKLKTYNCPFRNSKKDLVPVYTLLKLHLVKK